MNGGVVARRVGVVLFCVLSLVACVGLAWWQWQRFEHGGTWQNLGYVLQWPLFGLFPAFMFWRLRKLRNQHHEQQALDQRSGDQQHREPGTQPVSHSTPPAEPDIPPVRHDDEDDPELAAYNRYLAQLNAIDQQEKTR